MPRNETTGIFTRVDNSFSEPIAGTIIDPTDAIELFDDYDEGLSEAMGWFQPLRLVTASGAVTVSNTEAGVGINKSVGAATAVTIPSPATRNANGALPIQIKDIKGDAETNNITISASGGALIDGAATWVIAQAYGYTVLVPLADGSAYYVSSTGR